jgi:hypothetical protein
MGRHLRKTQDRITLIRTAAAAERGRMSSDRGEEYDTGHEGRGFRVPAWRDALAGLRRASEAWLRKVRGAGLGYE